MVARQSDSQHGQQIDTPTPPGRATAGLLTSLYKVSNPIVEKKSKTISGSERRLVLDTPNGPAIPRTAEIANKFLTPATKQNIRARANELSCTLYERYDFIGRVAEWHIKSQLAAGEYYELDELLNPVREGVSQ